MTASPERAPLGEGPELSWAALEALLDEALARPPGERSAFVRDSCAGDPRLERELLDLLAGSEEADLRFATRGLPGEQLAAPLRETPLAAEPEPPPQELVGRLLAARYRLDARLAEGGASWVYRGLDTLTGDPVAVKVMRTLGLSTRAVFRREVGVLRALQLPGVVRLLDEGLVEGRPFLVMELVGGQPFPGAVRQLDWTACAGIVRRFLAALDRLHWAGIIHGDLKPANVLVDAAGRPTIIDLGIARERRPATPSGGLVAGTPAYLAPEQLEGAPASVQSDLYAVGLMVYEALRGAPAHPAQSLAELLARRLARPEPDWEPLRATAPPAVVDLLRRLLAPAPADRPASVEELRGLLVAATPGPWRGERTLPPLLQRAEAAGPDQLRALFHGPDRLLHCREDAAAELWMRTGGEAHELRAELQAWVDAGLARWEEERLLIERPALVRLQNGLRVRPPRAVEEEAFAGPGAGLLELIDAAGAGVESETLARAAGCTPDALEEGLRALEARGWIRRTPAGRLLALRRPRRRERAVEAALLAALAPGSPGHLELLVAQGANAEVPGEAARRAARCLVAGELAAAAVALGEGLIAARRVGDAEGEEALLRDLVCLAFERETAGALEHALSELARALRPGLAVERLETLARAALWAMRGSRRRACEHLEALGPLEPPRVERWRRAVLRLAVRHIEPEREGQVLAQAVSWAEEHGDDPLLRASAAFWRGWLHYRRGRYAAAAQAHAECAAATPHRAARVGAWLNGASAWLEAHRLGQGAELARRARAEARLLRHVHYEARAEWLLRSFSYRGGSNDAPDDELLDAAAHIASPVLAAHIATSEAAFAWRAGDLPRARELASRGADATLRAGAAPVGLVARALRVAAGAREDPAEAAELGERAQELLPPGLTVQVLALLVDAAPGLRAEWHAAAQRAAASLARETWSRRREVLSVDEALERLRVRS